MLGIIAPGAGARDPDPAAYRAVASRLNERFLNVRKIAFTVRASHSASDNSWGGVLRDGRELHVAGECRVTPIVDRVAAGNATAACIICGIGLGQAPAGALDLAVAAACLKHSIVGDLDYQRSRRRGPLRAATDAGWWFGSVTASPSANWPGPAASPPGRPRTPVLLTQPLAPSGGVAGATHPLDLLLWLAGPAAVVTGRQGTFNHPAIEVEDDGRAAAAISRRSTARTRPGCRSTWRRCSDAAMLEAEPDFFELFVDGCRFEPLAAAGIPA